MNLEETFSNLVRLQIELWNAIDARLRAEHALPLSDFEGMRVIHSHDGCRVYDIADDLVITVGGASKLVDRIERSGYCARRANPGDRRSSYVELTRAGERLLALARGTVAEELAARLAEPLSVASLEQFDSTLIHLRATGAGNE